MSKRDERPGEERKDAAKKGNRGGKRRKQASLITRTLYTFEKTNDAEV